MLQKTKNEKQNTMSRVSNKRPIETTCTQEELDLAFIATNIRLNEIIKRLINLEQKVELIKNEINNKYEE